MNTTRVIVHESGRRWVEHVRARLHGQPVRVSHTATSQDCVTQVSGEGPAVLVAELGPRPAATLELVDRAVTVKSDLTVVVVARADQESLELPARELGAIEFLLEPITPRQVAELVARIVRSHNALAVTS